MDACNFPEFLALNLKKAESIFASKQMTAGPPRALGALGSPEVIRHQDPLSSEFIAQLKDYAKSCTRDPLSTDTAAVSVTGKGHGHAKLSMDSAQSDSETDSIDSIDSFVMTNNKSASLSSRRTESLSREHMLEPDEQATRNDTSGDDAHGNTRSTNSRISHRTCDSCASCEGYYGSLFGDYDYADDYDNCTIPSDAESVSSFGVSVPTSNWDRQQSVVTTATSVTSSDYHTSIRSHILSAMGPFSPVCESRHSLQSARSGASFGRRVEFSLNTDAADDRSMDANGRSAPKDINASRCNSDVRWQRHSEDAPASAAIVRRVPDETRASDDSSRDGRSSWLNVKGGSSDDGHDNDNKNKPPAFKANSFFRSAVTADQRPKSHGPSSRGASGPCSDLFPGPRTGDLALRRRSSLDTGQLKALIDTSSNLQQQRRPRHIAPFRAILSLRDAASVGAPSWSSNDGVLSPKSRESGSDNRAVSPMSPKASPAVAKTVDEVPLVLQKTAYAPASQSSPALENLRNFFDDDSDDDCAGVEGNVTSWFDDFDDAENEVQATSEAAKPFSRPVFGSIRSVRSRLPVSSITKPSFKSSAVSCDADPVNAEKTSDGLQDWVRHASGQQKQQDRRLPPPRPTAGNAQVASRQMPLAEEDGDTIPALSQPFDYSSFYHSGVVGIPLPRDVVETLRVSVSCFPETMLSLSSFSIQIIRSYSRKVRRCSPSESDSTFRLVMEPAPPNGVQPSQKTENPFAPLFLPSSPTTASFRIALSDPDTESWRTSTGVSISTTASHCFRKFKRLGNLRPSSSCNSLDGAGNASSARSPSLHIRNSRADCNGSKLPSSDEGRGKGSGICFKRIFPTGSDYLCDALYAHIVAFNYISLLCPPADAKPASHEPVSGAPSEAGARTWMSGSNTIATTSTATLVENGDKTKRQTIRGSGVPLDSLPMGSMAQLEGSAMLESPSPSPSPPPSCGRPDDAKQLISRKAASLLGITESLEPDMSNSHVLAKRSHQSVGSGLARRYQTIRQRHHRATSPLSVGGKEMVVTKKPLPVQSALVPATGPAALAVPKVPATTLSMSASMPMFASSSLAPASSASSDTHLRDLQAGLHHCISQLVSTLKLTTGQLDSTTVLPTETARELDPLFLRMLCELVRSQEEPI